MDLLNSILQLISKVAILGGSLWLLWGVIVLAGGLKNHEGPAIQGGIWQIVGGGMIISAAALFTTLTGGW
ncbi:hypothetical protein IT072_20785 (plasmid) [Leifsonia sp. ZF2019]|uniref:hypothetical protein n=1 Tax=Leifsonia sp. ZF2019 TaxID=2781978 RepID=UPI001CBE8F14|nr:hypothetical protein [Leifsonia sp. ZF2019]UAJ81783.1 hypothetical protein IT072_20785 [Leifsonia sp. ZF2019]